MSWSVGFDSNWNRDIGYGVPSICDHPGCKEEIHRGLAHVCGGEPYGGEDGCGLFFCDFHGGGNLCSHCKEGGEPFTPTPDLTDWNRWKLSDRSWKKWRDENPEEVARITKELASG